MPKSDDDYETAEILTVTVEERRRVGRRWVWAVLAIQAIILTVRLTGDWYAFYVGPPRDSLAVGWIWVAHFVLWTAAGVAWPTSVVIAPLIVAIACITAVETRIRTMTCVCLSVALTGVPLLIWRAASPITQQL